MFKCPLIHLGKGSLGKLSTLRGERALIVAGKNLSQLGVVGEVEKRLQAAKMNVKVFDEVEPDPNDLIVSNCAKIATEFKPDWFVGLGGGSPIDVAKAAFLLYERPDVKLSSFIPLGEYGLRKKSKLAAMSSPSFRLCAGERCVGVPPPQCICLIFLTPMLCFRIDSSRPR